MARRRRTTNPDGPTPARPSCKAGYTKITLVVPEEFAADLRAFAGYTGTDMAAVVVDQVRAHLDRRRFRVGFGDRQESAQEGRQDGRQAVPPPPHLNTLNGI